MQPAREGNQGQVVVASLNTRGMPIRGSRLAARYAAIAAAFEASDADVVNLQEMLSTTTPFGGGGS